MLSHARQRAAARPADAEAVGALARALHAWEQFEAAHRAYLRAQGLAPRTFEWRYLDGLVLQRLARHEDAARQFREAVAVQPSYLPARVKLAETLVESGALLESRKLLDALVREPAAEPAVQVALGRIAAMEGRHADAITHFERALSVFPELGAAYYGVARSYRAVGRTGDAERALVLYARYGARWPGLDDPVARSVSGLRDDAGAVLRKGLASAEEGDIEAAIAAHETALARDPSLIHVHANLVSLYGRVKNWQKADEHYRAAITAGFTPADLHYDYGVIMALREDWAAAEEAYRKAVAVNPLHASALNNLGLLLERRRDVEGALAHYRQAVAAQPTFRLSRFNVGRMLLAAGKPEQAVTEFEQLQQPRDAETPRYLFALSTALVRSGRREAGIRTASEAQRLAVDFGQADLAALIARELAALK
jgi:tetratricopeptide (TPR) repeat protein